VIEQQRLLRALEVAAILGLSRSKVFQLIASNDIPSVRIGRAVRVPSAGLRRWIEEQTEKQRGGR